MVPDCFRIDDGDGALRANAKTVGFASIHQRVRPGQAQFLQTLLQEFPGGAALRDGGAFWFVGFSAEKDVPRVFAQ